MTTAQVRGFSGRCQPAMRVLADRFEHAVAHAAEPLLGSQQGPVDKSGDGLEYHVERQRLIRADRLGRVYGAPAGEDGQPAEANLLGLTEQVVAPPDGRLERSVSRQADPPRSAR